MSPLDFRTPDAAAATGGGSWILVAENQDRLELINLNGPCAPGAGCPPNQTIALDRGSGPLRACTNDVNGDGVQDLCTLTSSGQFCEFVAQPNGSYTKVCTPVGVGATDAIPFRCSAGAASTCVAVAQPQPGNVGPGNILTFTVAPDGSLTARGSSPADVGPSFLATADLDGDGKADLVVVNTARNTISILLGNGNGNFVPAGNIGVGTAPVAVAVGDVNGDGKADILVSNSGSNNVSVLLGDGAGNFAAPKNIAVTGPPLGIAIGDLNLDGKPDFAVAYPSLNTVDVYLGDGAGGFTRSFTSSVEATPVAVVIADFDGDTKPDLAVINSGFPNFPNTQNIQVHYNAMVYPTCKLAGPPAINSVLNGASFQPGISPNGMITILGSGLQPAGQTHLAGGSDFVNGGFPTMLSCMAVEVDGIRAPLTYTSAGQINAQAPANLTAGQVTVAVILNPDSANAIVSNIFTAQAQAVSPAFFTFDGKSIATLDALTGAIVADPVAVPGAAPAKPGQILTLYGTGFGATNPPYQEGQIASGAAPVTTPFTVSIGGVTLASSDVLYGGLSPGSVSGLYQFNLRVPDAVADGNQPVVISIGGQQTQSGATIAVKH